MTNENQGYKKVFEKPRTIKVKQSFIRVKTTQFVLQKIKSYIKGGKEQNEGTIPRIYI